MPRASLFYSLGALAGVVAFGTVGFTLVEGWSLADSLYMTVMRAAGMTVAGRMRRRRQRRQKPSGGSSNL